MYRSEKRLYLTPDGRVTEDADEASGGKLLVPAGGEITNEEAERYGLKARAGLEDKGLKSLGSMTKAELEAVAAEKGLEVEGTKAEIIAAIEAAG